MICPGPIRLCPAQNDQKGGDLSKRARPMSFLREPERFPSESDVRGDLGKREVRVTSAVVEATGISLRSRIRPPAHPSARPSIRPPIRPSAHPPARASARPRIGEATGLALGSRRLLENRLPGLAWCRTDEVAGPGVRFTTAIWLTSPCWRIVTRASFPSNSL